MKKRRSKDFDLASDVVTMRQQILPAVSGIVFNEKREVLLHHRRDVGRWSLISGHVEFGETVSAAMLREIKEEINVHGQIIRLIGVYSMPSSQIYHYGDRSVQYVTTYFEVKLLAPLPTVFPGEETLDARFFPTSQLPDMAQINPFWLDDACNASEGPFFR